MNDILIQYRKGAKKIIKALEEGGFGHAIWCNFQHHEDPGCTFCNCGITDLIRAYEKDEKNES